MNREQYEQLVVIAKEMYDAILLPENRDRFTQQNLEPHQLGAITNRWLGFQNVKDAALQQDFSLVQIAYARNEALLAAMAATDQDKTAFVAWAVEYLRSNRGTKISQPKLFSAWLAGGAQRRNPKSFFTTTPVPRLQ